MKKIIKIEDIDFSKYDVITDKRGNRGKKEKARYLNMITSFDIETSTIYIPEKTDYYSFMYIWQWDFDGKTVIGRTWNDFRNTVQYIKEHIPDNVKLVAYVHNLAYEFSFLQGIYHFKTKDVFAPQSHKVLKAIMGPIEFRCNYKRTNMSLDMYLKQMDVDCQKKVGYLDYNKIRYPWTKLTEKELDYCISDVVGMTQAIKKDIELSNDDLITIPLTVTGYLRRDIKNSMKKIPYNRLRKIIPPYCVYRLLGQSFEGGDTHANRFFSGKILEEVESDDRSSSYPAVQLHEKFPMGQWHIPHKLTYDYLNRLSSKGYAYVAKIRLINIKMKDYYFPDPVISKSKCHICANSSIDNGRVLSADCIETTVTDIKLDIINDVYSYDKIEILEAYYSKYGSLPKEYTEIIKENYIKKTELKGVEGQEYYYFKRKEKTNSAYGMSAQDPVQLSYDFINNDFVLQSKDEEALYNKYIKNAFLSYAWGVWTTSHARKHLYEGIRIVYDQDKFVYYWDTDSVKHEKGADFTEYNKKRISECKKTGAYAYDKKGNIHYMGVYENEGIYDKFKTLGAKKYVIEKNGKLEITIAGVNKKIGAEELQKKGGIKNFKEGFIFTEAGGTKIKYHTNINFNYDTGAGVINITDNGCITPTEYTVGITADYRKLLSQILIDKFLNK